MPCASSRSGDAAFGCGGRAATGSREFNTGPGAQLSYLTLSAAVRVANACGRKLRPNSFFSTCGETLPACAARPLLSFFFFAARSLDAGVKRAIFRQPIKDPFWKVVL